MYPNLIIEQRRNIQLFTILSGLSYKRILMKEKLRTRGLAVETNIDPVLQESLENNIKKTKPNSLKNMAQDWKILREQP